MSIIIPANSAVGGGFEVANSCRFDSSYLTRTPSSASNRKTWTWSGWVKRSSLSTGNQILFEAKDSSGFVEKLQFNSSDQLEYDHDIAGTDYTVRSDMLFRDTSAWYHIVVAKDTTQSTETDRLLFYANGQGLSTTEFQLGYPPQNYDGLINSTNAHYVGSNSTSEYFVGYMSEVVFINAAQLAPTSFGEFDEDSGVWKPLESVADLTFSTNGFYQNYQDSSALGNDVSGNNNDFSTSGLAAIDQTTDTCTNNFCTWNFIADNQDVTFSEGNTKVAHGSSLTRRPVVSSFGVDKGKWYWEWEAEGSPSGGNLEIGIINYASPSTQGRYLGQALTTGSSFATYIGDGSIVVASSVIGSSFATYSGGNVIGVAVDVDNEKIYFYKDGSLVNSGGTDYSSMSAGSGFIFMSNADRSGSSTYTASVNFGQPNATLDNAGVADGNGFGSFEHTPPSGYLSLCTTNISETNS